MKYVVTVRIISSRTKELNIYAATEIEAEEKAWGLVMDWDGVDDVETLMVEEDE